MNVYVGDRIHMKKFRMQFPDLHGWADFSNPDKKSHFVFMFLGSEPIDGSAPLKTDEIMAGLGWGDLEKLEKQTIANMRAEFEVTGAGLTGSTTVPVKRVESEDDGSYKVVLDYWPKDVIQLDHLTSHGEQIVTDAIRSAYDRGYNDSRAAKSIPGDSAPGYRGRSESADISGETLGRLRHLSALNRPDDTLTDLVDRLMTEIKPLDDTPPSIQTQANIRLVDAVHEAVSILKSSALNRPDDALWRFWNDKARSLATDNAALRKLIADNWCGDHWRAVNHRHSDEVRSALNPINKAPTQ